MRPIASWVWLGLALAVASWLLVGCMGVVLPGEEGLVESMQWRMDKTGQDSLQDVEQATDWQALPEWKSWGFGREAIWVRLQLKAATQGTRLPWTVRVRPTFLDYITLYDPASNLVLRTGDALPPDIEDLTSINFTLSIPALPHERTVYLRLQTTSSRTLNVDVLPYGQVQQMNRLQEWVVGFVMTCSAIFALLAFVQWWETREKLIGAFALKQLFATAWFFFALGFARLVIGPWLSEGVLTTITSMLFLGIISVGVWFYILVIEGYGPSRLFLWALRSLAILVPLSSVLHWMGHTHLMLELANMSVLLLFALLLFALLTAIPGQVKQPIPLMFLLAYMVVYSTLNSVPPLILLDWIEAKRTVMVAGLSHALLDGAVMFVLLQVRARALRNEQLQVTLELQSSQQQAESERLHRAEQSQLFSMLAHEMKTPLATLRMWMEADQLKPARMERAIADMNQVIERCVHTGQLADGGLQPDWQSVDGASVTHACVQSCRLPDKVDLRLPDMPATLNTDPQMLSIVLGNLLDNACKYGAPGEGLSVSLVPDRREGREGWRWDVGNQAGPAGLPDAGRLYEKYYRSPQARRLSGSGLGLFLVKGLLDLMEGAIDYGTAGQQVVFSIWLPDTPAHYRAAP
jgi:two-component system, sensor histidine kinase LadS